jgi:iron complex outermembrane receptor protein
VSSWTTLDLNFSYAIARHSGGPLSGTTFSLSAENVFDRKPPFLNNSVGVGYDQENGELTGRFLSLSVRKTW